MKGLLMLAVVIPCLASCVGFEYDEFYANGNPKRSMSLDSFMAKGEASASEKLIARGKITRRTVHQNYDGTEVPTRIIDAKETLGLAGLLKDERVNDSNNKLALGLEKEKTAQIPLKGEAEVNKINANAAAAAAQE